MQFKKLKFQNFHKYIKYITTPFSGEKNSEKKRKIFFSNVFLFQWITKIFAIFFCSCNFYFIMLCWGSMLKMNEHIAGVICDHIQIWQ